MSKQAYHIGFFQACVEERGPKELARLPREEHSAALLLNYTRDNGVSISMPRGRDDSYLENAVSYGAHALALKEKHLSGNNWRSNSYWGM